MLCRNCDTDKPEVEFYLKLGKYRTPCKECSRKYNRERKIPRAENRQKYYRSLKEQKTSWLYELLSTSSCKDCGELDPIVLEFDHIRGHKYRGIAQLVSSLFSLELLQQEVEKCEIVCANCHRRRTVERCNGHRYLYFRDSTR